MDFETILATLVMVVLPSWFNAQEGIKKGRNFLICYLLSSLMVCGVWVAFGMWLMSLNWIYDLVKGLDITWWIGAPIYFVLAAITSIAQFLIIKCYPILYMHYFSS